MKNEKSMLLSVMLSLFFGPFGLFYTSVLNAVIMLCIPVVLIAIGLVMYGNCNCGVLSACDKIGIYAVLVSWYLVIHQMITIILSITGVLKNNRNLKQ